jgi:hypothetical protein
MTALAIASSLVGGFDRGWALGFEQTVALSISHHACQLRALYRVLRTIQLNGMSGRQLPDAIKQLPSIVALQAIQKRNLQRFAELNLGVSGLAQIGVGVGAGDDRPLDRERSRSPQRAGGLDRAIARARSVLELVGVSEAQLDERLQEALDSLTDVGNVPADRRPEMARLINELEDALRPAVPLPSPPRASQADRLAVRSELLRANEALRQLEPVSRVDGLDDGAIGQLVERLEQQRERLRDAAQRVAGDSDLVDEIESTDLRLRSVVYLLESLVEK